MACAHSRVSRLYYCNQNKNFGYISNWIQIDPEIHRSNCSFWFNWSCDKDGEVGSDIKVQIDWMNNLRKEIFQVSIESDNNEVF